MNKKIAVLSGDGIGPEIMDEAIKVLKTIENVFGHSFIYEYAPIGGQAWDAFGTHFPEKTAQICKDADAILFGSVGGAIDQQHLPKWRNCERNTILAIRKALGLTSNLRPVQGFGAFNEIDLMCVRELSEDVYFGPHETTCIEGERVARDVMIYHESTIRAIAHQAFQIAMSRQKKITSVDKANVLDCSKLWREVVTEVSKEYPECTLEHMLVDNCAMQLMKNPTSFDVLLMPNLFGDILSDLASVSGGSLGMLPSASLNRQGIGLYEPAGGSAPDIAGKRIANPIGQILSAALMLKHSFGMDEEHDAIVEAVKRAVQEEYRTPDIAGKGQCCSTAEMGDAIVNFINKKKIKKEETHEQEHAYYGFLFF
jgi:3-isopropylmalate dehydrogenase